MRQAQEANREATDEELSKYVSDLIRRKAKQLVRRSGFSESDRGDIEQELYLKVVKHASSYDPAAGHPKVFAKTVIERQVATVLRDSSAEKRHHRSVCSLNVVITEPEEGPVEFAATIAAEEKDRRLNRNPRPRPEMMELRSDIADLLASLPDDLRDLCERLMYDHVSQVARDLGVPRTTLNEKVRLLRRRFENANLREYLD